MSSLLETLHNPADLRRLSRAQLPQVADEVSQTGQVQVQCPQVAQVDPLVTQAHVRRRQSAR